MHESFLATLCAIFGSHVSFFAVKNSFNSNLLSPFLSFFVALAVLSSFCRWQQGRRGEELEMGGEGGERKRKNRIR